MLTLTGTRYFRRENIYRMIFRSQEVTHQEHFCLATAASAKMELSVTRGMIGITTG